MSDTTHRIYINRAHVFNEGVTWTTIAGLYPHAYVPEDAFTALQAENDKLTAAIKRQSGAAKTLRASIMAEVQHLKDIDRSEYFAAKSLDSEREANSILTAERDAWKARAEELEAKQAGQKGTGFNYFSEPIFPSVLQLKAIKK